MRPVWRVVFDYEREILPEPGQQRPEPLNSGDGVAQYVDVNGDNLIDLLYLANDSTSTRDGIWYVHFSALTGSLGDDLSNTANSTVGRRSSVVPVDFDLDGLVDYVSGGLFFRRTIDGRFEPVSIGQLQLGGADPQFGTAGRFVVDPAMASDLDLLLWSDQPAQAGTPALFMFPLDLPDDVTGTIEVAGPARTLSPAALSAGESLRRVLPFANGSAAPTGNRWLAALVSNSEPGVEMRLLELGNDDRYRVARAVQRIADGSPDFLVSVRRERLTRANTTGDRRNLVTTNEDLVMVAGSANAQRLVIFSPALPAPVDIPLPNDAGTVIGISTSSVAGDPVPDLVILTQTDNPRTVKMYMVLQDDLDPAAWSTT